MNKLYPSERNHTKYVQTPNEVQIKFNSESSPVKVQASRQVQTKIG